ncbi:MAG: hypothetical protein ACLPSH_12055 [Vulcanimicrobiaceae bacterium]
MAGIDRNEFKPGFQLATSGRFWLAAETWGCAATVKLVWPQAEADIMNKLALALTFATALVPLAAARPAAAAPSYSKACSTALHASIDAKDPTPEQLRNTIAATNRFCDVQGDPLVQYVQATTLFLLVGAYMDAHDPRLVEMAKTGLHLLHLCERGSDRAEAASCKDLEEKETTFFEAAITPS